MADFIHGREYLEGGDIVIVDCSHQCNIRVMDDLNFQSFRTDRRHNYCGGFYKMFPARIAVPHDGYWNVTIDLGGGRAKLPVQHPLFEAGRVWTIPQTQF